MMSIYGGVKHMLKVPKPTTGCIAHLRVGRRSEILGQVALLAIPILIGSHRDSKHSVPRQSGRPTRYIRWTVRHCCMRWRERTGFRNVAEAGDPAKSLESSATVLVLPSAAERVSASEHDDFGDSDALDEQEGAIGAKDPQRAFDLAPPIKR